MLNRQAIIETIYKADEQGDPAFIFTLAPEESVWQYAAGILEDLEHGYLIGPILLRGIHAAFDQLKDQRTASSVLLHALNPSLDSLVYHTSKQAVLNLASSWDNDTARQFYTAFEKGYLTLVENGDQFIAVEALEGAVMLPLYRNDRRLLYKAMGLLLNDFPPIPDDPSDPAYLPVKGLKLLRYCYDLQPDEAELAQKIQEHIGTKNFAVDTEARFNRGLTRLQDAFRASDIDTLQAALRDAYDLFQAAYVAEDNRTDAELFSAITQCYLIVLTNSLPTQVAEIVHRTQGILIERLLAFGGTSSPLIATVEFNLVRLVTHLQQWAEQLATAEKWPNILPPMSALAEMYKAIQLLEITEGLIGAASGATKDLIILPKLIGRLAQVQEISAKLERVLVDEAWQETTSASEIAFYKLVLEEVRTESTSPKDWATAELGRVQAVARHDAPELAQLINELQASGLETRDILIQIAWRRIEAEQDLPIHGDERRIFNEVASDLRDKLNWQINQPEWKFLAHALRLVVRYLIRVYRATPGEAAPTNVSFLFAKPKGLRKEATEKHLETHFREKMWFGEGLDLSPQPVGIVLGRPDLAFHFPDNIDFPIEVKREFQNITRDHIRDQYIAQAQSYAAGTTNRVSFLFVLDLTRKAKGVPLIDIADCCYVDQRLVPGAVHPNWVVVVIVPANRHLPSAHSWERDKK